MLPELREYIINDDMVCEKNPEIICQKVEFFVISN